MAVRNFPFRYIIYTKKEIDEIIENLDIDLTNYYDKSEIDTKLADKQDKLTAGTNISISEENVISATGGTEYTAGNNIQISEQNVISATDTVYTAGTGITIDANNVISASGGGGWTERIANDDWSDLIDSSTMTVLKETLIVYKNEYYYLPKGYKTSYGNPIILKDLEFGNYNDWIQITDQIEIESSHIPSSQTSFKRVTYSINKALDSTTNGLTVHQETTIMNKAGLRVFTKD